MKIGGLQPVAVVASAGDSSQWPDGDLFTAVADLAKRKGQNAMRPDIIRMPLSGLDAIAPLTEELTTPQRRRRPIGGQIGSGLIVDAADDFAGAATVAPQLTGIGGIKLSSWAFR